MKYIKLFLIYTAFLSSILSATCLVYIVLWLTAVSDWMISMGWLV
jgi:hypothetical protein